MKGNKVELKCYKCGKTIFVDKTALTWGGNKRMCKNCSIKSANKNYII